MRSRRSFFTHHWGRFSLGQSLQSSQVPLLEQLLTLELPPLLLLLPSMNGNCRVRKWRHFLIAYDRRRAAGPQPNFQIAYQDSRDTRRQCPTSTTLEPMQLSPDQHVRRPATRGRDFHGASLYVAYGASKKSASKSPAGRLRDVEPSGKRPRPKSALVRGYSRHRSLRPARTVFALAGLQA